ncbi:MAG TPA: [Fe-Fe] hydrogenase large subunit C-terminal domain-containing protein, partial [Candidatus Ozemobacteraceae bacterium]|nr:[Fe-Fe] hydrogenase large subunit C-terminal domain-containing protein [Candidatus Ozemobacteraceae bacterium]
AALKAQVEHHYPEAKVTTATADTLFDCRIMVKQILAKSLTANLVEGMACPGGCVGGPGTLAPIRKSTAEVGKFVKTTPIQGAWEAPDHPVHPPEPVPPKSDH